MNKIMKFIKKFLPLPTLHFPLPTVFLLLSLCACHPAALEMGSGLDTYQETIGKLVAGKVKSGESVAVVGFYDGENGDYTALGDQWRDRAETFLAGTGVETKAVRDMGLILNILETAERDFDEGEVWRRSGSDYIITGHYYLSKGVGSDGRRDALELHLKLLDVRSQRVAAAAPWTDWLEKGWQRRYAIVRGNVYQKAIEVFSPDEKDPGPRLTAKLDRKNPCYPAGAAISLDIESEAGAHLYILNVAADRTVTLNYPNRYLPDKGLLAARFTFPPPEMKNLRLEVYPMPEDNPSREAFKVIASYRPLDFSFLKVPDGRIFAGAAATELKKVLETLKNARGFSEVTLKYTVGRGCE